MPIYEYECLGCNKVHEVIQKLSDSPLGSCPNCGSPVTKRMSLSSFALKGQGWYTTDYKRSPKLSGEIEKQAENQKKSEKPNVAESKPSPEVAPKSQVKTESKTE